MKSTCWAGRLLRQAVRVVSAGFTVAVLLLVAVAIAVTTYVWEAVTRFDINPKALSDFMHEAVTVTIREGSPKQKLETIAALEQVKGADAVPFVPALMDATKDRDLQVRAAARKTLDRIAPVSPKEDEEE